MNSVAIVFVCFPTSFAEDSVIVDVSALTDGSPVCGNTDASVLARVVVIASIHGTGTNTLEEEEENNNHHSLQIATYYYFSHWV